MFPIRDTIPSRNPPVAVWAVISACVFVFLFEMALPQYKLEALFFQAGLVPARYSHAPLSEWFSPRLLFPFFACMFLHGGWMHIIGNMWSLWLFGDNVEDRMGPARFLVFYVLCGLVAGAVHVALHPSSQVPVVGASGAIAGVMGAYLVMFPLARVIVLVPVLFLPLFFELPAVLFIGLWYLSQLFNGMFSLAGGGSFGGVAWWAHVGGFAAGVVLHRFFLLPRGRRRRPFADEFGLEGAW